MTNLRWHDLYLAKRWDELDDWWRYSEDKPALEEMFNWLVENIPKVSIENGTESTFRPISSTEAPEGWKYAASTLEQGELEAMIIGTPPTAIVDWEVNRPEFIGG